MAAISWPPTAKRSLWSWAEETVKQLAPRPPPPRRRRGLLSSAPPPRSSPLPPRAATAALLGAQPAPATLQPAPLAAAS